MPEHKSCKKRIRTDAKRNQQNKYVKKTISTMIKKVKSAENKEEMNTLLPNVYSVLDKAVKKGVIRKGNADRKKARIAAFVNKH